MILIFLGNFRATLAVMLSIPLSALAAFLAINAGGGSINSMVLGGLALAFSRLIDNSVVVLENIFRHLEEGEDPEAAAERGGQEVALPVLAATFTTAIVFFPVVFLYGVSRFLFMALAASVVLSLFASYMVAMTVVPLFCARFIKARTAMRSPTTDRRHWFARFVTLVQPQVRPDADALRHRGRQDPAAPGGYGDRHPRRMSLQPWAVSASGCLILPAHRPRTVRDQHQGADRHAHRADQRVHQARRRRHPPGRRRQATWA